MNNNDILLFLFLIFTPVPFCHFLLCFSIFSSPLSPLLSFYFLLVLLLCHIFSFSFSSSLNLLFLLISFSYSNSSSFPYLLLLSLGPLFLAPPPSLSLSPPPYSFLLFSLFSKNPFPLLHINSSHKHASHSLSNLSIFPFLLSFLYVSWSFVTLLISASVLALQL